MQYLASGQLSKHVPPLSIILGQSNGRYKVQLILGQSVVIIQFSNAKVQWDVKTVLHAGCALLFGCSVENRKYRLGLSQSDRDFNYSPS